MHEPGSRPPSSPSVMKRNDSDAYSSVAVKMKCVVDSAETLTKVFTAPRVTRHAPRKKADAIPKSAAYASSSRAHDHSPRCGSQSAATSGLSMSAETVIVSMSDAKIDSLVSRATLVPFRSSLRSCSIVRGKTDAAVGSSVSRNDAAAASLSRSRSRCSRRTLPTVARLPITSCSSPSVSSDAASTSGTSCSTNHRSASLASRPASSQRSTRDGGW
mmetsp:Transcript_34505/g.87556  ORF Transcript_34505/g.87556 Transcript_34505/m.87556 type:complete len:216 (-) Transcript_34505:73-720(-)